MKEVDIYNNTYIFETIEELILMLKDDNCKVNLIIEKKGRFRKTKIDL